MCACVWHSCRREERRQNYRCHANNECAYHFDKRGGWQHNASLRVCTYVMCYMWCVGVWCVGVWCVCWCEWQTKQKHSGCQIHTHIYSTHIHTHTHTHTLSHTANTYVFTLSVSLSLSYIHTQTHTHTRTNAHHTHYTIIRTHTHTHIYIYVHTYNRKLNGQLLKIAKQCHTTVTIK